MKTDWAQMGVHDKCVTNTLTGKEGISALLGASLAMDVKLIQGATQAHRMAVS